MADAFPISGQIDPNGFPFLLLDLHRHGATGSLKVDGPSYQKALYFRGGRVLFGSSNDPRDQLGAILIESGKITPEQLEDVNTKVAPGSPLAKVLADTGFVNQRELSESARAKVERILSDVIAYTSGSFEFEDGVLPKGAIDLKLSTERLVLSAVRRVSDRNFVLRHLESLEVVLLPTAQIAGVSAEVLAETGSLHEQMDGHRTLKEAASLARMEEFEAAKIACALLFLGMVERVQTAPPEVVADAPFFSLPDDGSGELDLGQVTVGTFSPESMHPETTEENAFMPADPPAFSAPPEAYSDSPQLELGVQPEYDVSYTPPFPPPEPEPAEAEPDAATERVPEPESEPMAETAILAPSSLPWGVSAEAAHVPEPASPTEDDTEHQFMPPPQTSRPSKDDLAALDALLNSRSAEDPEAGDKAAAAASRTWSPQFSTGAPSRRGRRSSGSSRGLIMGGVAVVGLAVAAGAWYFVAGPGAGARPVSRPSPVAPPASTVAAAASPAVASAEPPATTLAAPVATPVVTTPVATTSGATTSGATTSGAAPATLAAAPPTTRPAPPPPTTASAPATPSGGLAEARGLMQKGQLPEAARAFAANVVRQAPAGSASIQLLIACSAETIQKAVASVPGDEMFIVPVNYKGKDCFRMCWGLYPSAARASSAVHSVPEYFRKGGAAPKVVGASELLK